MERNKKRNLEDVKVELEDQFILRLPKEDAKFVRTILREKPKKIKKIFKIQLDESLCHGTVYVKKKALPATIVSLPTIVECSKTLNNVNIYKTAAISQMLLCGEQKQEVQPVTSDTAKQPDTRKMYPHGLTPPMKNVQKQRFRKTMKNNEDIREAADVQKEVSLLLRMDYDAVVSRFEILTLNNNKPDEEVTEKMLFGAISSEDSEGSSTTLYDIMEFNN